jgi:hypothetical protein
MGAPNWTLGVAELGALFTKPYGAAASAAP